MRWIGTIHHEAKGLAFSRFLDQKGIGHQIEIKKETAWENPDYGLSYCEIWIYDENQVEQADQWLKLYQQNEEDTIFKSVKNTPLLSLQENLNPILDSSISSHSAPIYAPKPWSQQPLGIVTRLLFIICCLLFFGVKASSSSFRVPIELAGWNTFSSPIEQKLLYDFPYSYELIQKLSNTYVLEEDTTDPFQKNLLKRQEQNIIQEIKSSSVWQGVYPLFLNKKDQSVFSAVLFEKIRQGEVWRLFTPALLHADIFHLFFNMAWLLLLGKQIEQRIKAWRYIILILAIGVVSNTAQYIMSGPNFLGISGVLTGMLAFIWVRQIRTAWEGYQMDRLTLLFMLVFILGMAGIQFFSFILERSFAIPISPNIANTAHIFGGLTGYILGHFNYFSWRHT